MLLSNFAAPAVITLNSLLSAVSLAFTFFKLLVKSAVSKPSVILNAPTSAKMVPPFYSQGI
jgi:hypothetical protein